MFALISSHFTDQMAVMLFSLLLQPEALHERFNDLDIGDNCDGDKGNQKEKQNGKAKGAGKRSRGDTEVIHKERTAKTLSSPLFFGSSTVALRDIYCGTYPWLVMFHQLFDNLMVPIASP
jgi:hypothetical protein